MTIDVKCNCDLIFQPKFYVLYFYFAWVIFDFAWVIFVQNFILSFFNLSNRFVHVEPTISSKPYILENFLHSILIFVYLLSTLTSHCEFSYLTTLFLTYLPNCVVVSFFGFLVPHNESVTARWAIFGFQFNHLTKKL